MPVTLHPLPPDTTPTCQWGNDCTQPAAALRHTHRPHLPEWLPVCHHHQHLALPRAPMPRGRCRHCGTTRAVTAFGNTYPHRYGPNTCPGGNLPPLPLEQQS